jgi:hypothetical protein
MEIQLRMQLRCEQKPDPENERPNITGLAYTLPDKAVPAPYFYFYMKRGKLGYELRFTRYASLLTPPPPSPVKSPTPSTV